MSEITAIERLDHVFKKQKAASRNNQQISLKSRLSSLNALEALLLTHMNDIEQAINQDFGNRAKQETLMLEIFGLLGAIKFTKKKLKKWMKPQKRYVGLSFFGAKNTVTPQAKGVVGIISPWNYPLFLALSPCISAMAAGNRCIIKMASNAKHLRTLMNKLIPQYFEEDVLALINDIDGNSFTDLPWDHLVFTGSPSVGKTVMSVAAKHLTPVSLELGGKSPAIITEHFDLKETTRRVLLAKYLNAGQTCVAPDHIYIPREKIDEFVLLAQEIVSQRYAELSIPDYTAIIDESAFNRLNDALTDATSKGAQAVNLIGGDNTNKETRKIAPHLLLNVDHEMTVMQDEIFGPLLPVIAYDSLADVVDKINQTPRPLALYLYSNDKAEQDFVINNTMSGGICLNDSMLHVAQHDLPFGGIGNSGMGHYHGQEGFNEFSKLRPIFKQAKKSAILDLAPPYGDAFEKITKTILKWKLY